MNLGEILSSVKLPRPLAPELAQTEITGLALTTPAPLSSAESKPIVDSGLLSTRSGLEYLLEIEFDRGGREQIVDFRPRLPLVFRV